MKNQPSIALGTWSWNTGFAGGDQVYEGAYIGRKESLQPTGLSAKMNI